MGGIEQYGVIQSSKKRKDRAVWEIIDYGGNIEHKGIIYCRRERGNLDKSGVIQRNIEACVVILYVYSVG